MSKTAFKAKQIVLGRIHPVLLSGSYGSTAPLKVGRIISVHKKASRNDEDLLKVENLVSRKYEFWNTNIDKIEILEDTAAEAKKKFLNGKYLYNL